MSIASPIAFTAWPENFARRYREKGYWLDVPMTEILAQQCAGRPDAIAVIDGDRQLSYAEIDRLSQRLAVQLARRGLRTHDTALVQLPNVAEYYVVYFALLKLGVAPVNALFSHQRLELRSYAHQIQPRLLIADASHSLFGTPAFIDELRDIVPGLQTTLLLGHARHADMLATLMAEDISSEGVTLQPSAGGEVAFFQLSGGSTGTPKLIPRTHNDYYYSVRRSAEICRLTPQTRFLCALPAAHNFPMSSPGALGVFHAGGCVVLAPNPEALACFALIERHGVDIAALVPPAVSLWLQAAPAHRAQLRSLRLLQVGGASFADTLARRVRDELGCQLQQVFGMAEGLVNYTRLEDDDEHILTTQGRPMCADDEVHVIDHEGSLVADGETGMLVTRGPYTFRGYYNSADYNRRVIDAEGFYHSGDLVQRSADGYLRVVGRVKDQINRGGEKIAAEEIEHLLLQHEAITHAALVAMPDDLFGEKSCAYIVSRDATLRPVALRRYLRTKGVADFKLPDHFELVPQLPLTAVGKIDKERLRKQIKEQIAPGATFDTA
jgi:2,3-dihydroxybenzoate-AMP ligase